MEVLPPLVLGTSPAKRTPPTSQPLPDLEERFRKIGSVLGYLLRERQHVAKCGMENQEPEDLPVVTVTEPKAYLRSGPGKQHSPVIAISKGTRLVVEESVGEWKRVIAPTGNSMWIAASVVDPVPNQ